VCQAIEESTGRCNLNYFRSFHTTAQRLGKKLKLFLCTIAINDNGLSASSPAIHFTDIGFVFGIGGVGFVRQKRVAGKF
jgi:hypothetical protein